ncbi:MAG: hypothetical protein IJJ26_00660 [Victivallales bacterium]|nr:hypothetical protein [Victivallales bacterium]
MKQLVILLIIVLAILALVFMKPAPKKASGKPSTPAPTEQQANHDPSPEELVNTAPKQTKPEVSKPQERQRPAEAATSVASEVNSVINYGMGATQIKAKKNAVQKIRSIENKHNQDLDNALK